MKKKFWIQTYTGQKFDYGNIKGNKIVIEDIAHALSNISRFTGHSSDFYSVAQHSIYVSKNVPEEDALWGLLHDASEAYAGDVNKPLKNKLGDSYRDIEAKIHRQIAKAFKLPGSIPMSVHLADMRLLLTEKRDLFTTTMSWDGYVGIEPFNFKIKPWTPKVAKRKFLERFKYFY
jgi:uncharacterized protein